MSDNIINLVVVVVAMFSSGFCILEVPENCSWAAGGGPQIDEERGRSRLKALVDGIVQRSRTRRKRSEGEAWSDRSLDDIGVEEAPGLSCKLATTGARGLKEGANHHRAVSYPVHYFLSQE